MFGFTPFQPGKVLARLESVHTYAETGYQVCAREVRAGNYICQTMDIAEQRLYYNQHWQEGLYQNRLKLARGAKIIDAVFRAKKYDATVIDLGCGTGWLTAMLGQFYPALGVDLSDTAIAAATIRHPHVQFLATDIFTWNFPKGEADIVVSQEVIEHTSNPQRYLEIAWELLKPGGYLVLTTPNAGTMKHLKPGAAEQWTDQPLNELLTMPQLKTLLKNRFEVLQADSFILGYGKTGWHYIANIKRLHSAMKWLGLADAYNRFWEKRGFGLHLFALARKR